MAFFKIWFLYLKMRSYSKVDLVVALHFPQNIL